MRYRLFANVLLSCVLLPALALPQDNSTPQDIGDPEHIYRIVYEQALADSILTADESALLENLRRELMLEDDIIESALGESAPSPPGTDYSGRWTMMGQNMAWAAGLYGWGIPYVLDIKDDKLRRKMFVASETFSLGAALYLTWKYTSRSAFPEARSTMQRHGELLGLHTGIAIFYLNEGSPRQEVTTIMLTVPVGAYLGDRLYQRWKPSTGQAYALTIHAQLGANVVGLIHHQIDIKPENPFENAPDEDNQFYTPVQTLEQDLAEQKYDEWQKDHQPYLVAGYPLGLYLGHKFYGDRQYSLGDAAMLAIGRATGAFYGLMTASLLDLDDSLAVSWRYITTAGDIAGLILMDRYITGYDYSFGQAAIMSLGGIAGAAFGSGVGVLIDAKRKPMITLVLGGTTLGYSMIRKIVEPTPEYRAASTNDETKVSLSILPAFAAGKLVPMGNMSFSW
ncbi:hypothetical protein ACFL6E_03175 [Candidatus Neomarinimicrobiota bacterium]